MEHPPFRNPLWNHPQGASVLRSRLPLDNSFLRIARRKEEEEGREVKRGERVGEKIEDKSEAVSGLLAAGNHANFAERIVTSRIRVDPAVDKESTVNEL